MKRKSLTYYKLARDTYHPREEEAREEVPEAQEKGHHNGRNLVAWRECYKHHAVQCEVDKAHQYEVVEPEELVNVPSEPNH